MNFDRVIFLLCTLALRLALGLERVFQTLYFPNFAITRVEALMLRLFDCSHARFVEHTSKTRIAHVTSNSFYKYYSESDYEEEIARIISSFSVRQNSFCCVLFHPTNQTEKESRQIFLITKSIATNSEFNWYVLTTSFRYYAERMYGPLHKKVCSKVIALLLGWHQNAQQQFSQFSREIFMPNFIWLIFLKPDMTTEKYLENVNAPFNAELIIAELKENRFCQLKEGYRVVDHYPLRVTDYGFWNKTHLTFSTDIFIYRRRKDLEGFPIRGSTKDDYPISKLENADAGYKIEGYFGSVYYKLSELLNFTAVYVPADENVTGSSDSNGQWNGLIGMMQRNSVDLAVGPISYAGPVLKVAGIVRPLLRTNYQIFFKQDGSVIEWNSILKPFERYVWLSIVVWVLFGSFALNQMYYWGCKLDRENLKFKEEYTKLNSFLTFLKALCQQGSSYVPESVPCRILYITGYLISTILLTAYSGSLISNLTTEEPKRPFDSLKTFLEDGSYKLTAIVKSTDYTYFSEAEDELRVDIYDRLMKNIPEKELPIGKEEGIEQVCTKKKLALFITFAVTQLTAAQFSTERSCPVLYFRSALDKTFLSIGRRRNLTFSSLIDYQILSMDETGILRRMRNQEWPLAPEKPKVDFRQVTIEQVTQIYVILIFGSVISVIVLISEIYFRHIFVTGKYFKGFRKKIVHSEYFGNLKNSLEKSQTVIFSLLSITIIIFVIYVF